MNDRKMPEAKTIKDAIAKFEKMTKISVRHHLGFGNADKEIHMI